MPVGNEVEELPSWEEEHIEKLEIEVVELRDKVTKLTKELNEKPTSLDYKERYEECLKKLQAYWDAETPF